MKIPGVVGHDWRNALREAERYTFIGNAEPCGRSSSLGNSQDSRAANSYSIIRHVALLTPLSPGQGVESLHRLSKTKGDHPAYSESAAPLEN